MKKIKYIIEADELRFKNLKINELRKYVIRFSNMGLKSLDDKYAIFKINFNATNDPYIQFRSKDKVIYIRFTKFGESIVIYDIKDFQNYERGSYVN